MATEFQLWLMDSFGNRVAVVPNEQITKLTYTLTSNAVGSLVLTVPRDALPDAYVVRDAAMEVWRKPDGGTLQREGNTQWLITKETRGLDKDGARYRRIVAEPLTTLLSRRYIMYTQAAGPTAKTGNIDVILKDIWDENFGTSANLATSYTRAVNPPSRRWDSLIGRDAAVTGGPSIGKSGMGFRNVLSVMQEICRSYATIGGLAWYFDVVVSGTSTLTFRTWSTTRGIDRSFGPSRLVVSAERGSLGGTIEVTNDWSGLATWMVAGGAGQEIARPIGSGWNDVLIGQSRFGVIEGFMSETSVTDTDDLAADASGELYDRSARTKSLTGDLISVPGAVYGLDWGWGDRIVAEFEDDSFRARLDTVTVTLERGQETITAAIKAETSPYGFV